MLVERGFFDSRSRAAAAVMAGGVRLGPEGDTAAKPGQLVADDVRLEVAPAPAFVSRGGLKLAHALDSLGLDPAGRRCMDVGASTGGFTDCLLQRGAAHVVAVDVAYGGLHWRVRSDHRVTVVERTNARALTPAQLPYRPDLVVADLSFIGLTKVLEPVLAYAAARFDALMLVKPQFEVGRDRLGAGGVVRDPAHRAAAVLEVAEAAAALGWGTAGTVASPLPGPAGNVEFFLWLRRDAAPPREDDVRRAVEEGPG